MPRVKPKTCVYLFGSLVSSELDPRNNPIILDLETPSPLCEVLNLLPVPLARVQVAMVNHRAVSPDHVVYPGDRIALFPKEYALFADWKDFRF
jgi:hypothetical protein